MKYIFTMVTLTALFVVSEAGCPSMCVCSDTSVLCIQKELESVPSFESLLNDPVIIDLSGNKINMIDSDDFSFDKSDKVKEIYLNSTELLDIDSEAFDELENLQELYLGDNLLNSLPSTLIEHLPNMILLDISNNHFSGDMPKLFSKSLEVLAVANSKVTNIPKDSLKDLPNLKMLLLQQNNINSIDPVVFDGINKNSFFVRLSYNLWDCGCENIELFEFLADKKFVDTSEPYECRTEDGKYINVYNKGVIKELKGKCLNVIKKQVTKDLSTYKEDRYVIEEEQDMLEEELLKMQQSEQPYSLIKENNDTSIDYETEDEDSMAVDYGNDETEDKPDENYDGYVKNIDYTKEDEIMEEYEGLDYGTRFTFNINIGALIAVLCSFIVGVIFGICITRFTSLSQQRNLETSDSRTKLLVL